MRKPSFLLCVKYPRYKWNIIRENRRADGVSPLILDTLVFLSGKPPLLKWWEHVTKESKLKYNYPYIEASVYFPNVYTLSMLAYTNNWRSKENLKIITDAFNHINDIMKPETNIHVRIKGRHIAPCCAFVRPVRPFSPGVIDIINYRRLLTVIAMAGAGMGTSVIRETADNINEALSKDGILYMDFKQPHKRHYSPKNLKYPQPYTDVMLEASYNGKNNENAMCCDLTFWALEFLFLAEK